MELLRQGAKMLGLSLSPQHLEQFDRYYRELTAWNEQFNLTTITRYEDVQVRHFLDSLSCLLAFPQGSPQGHIPDTIPLQRESHSLWCLDVGSGAGFPGLPLKVMLPGARMTLIEATGKKASFLEQMVLCLELQDVQVLHSRAEDAAHLPQHREAYDVVLARAVANLSVLSEYCLPYCRLGGRMIAPKGEDARLEAEAARYALDLLGGELVAVKQVELPGMQTERYLVVIDKVARTPDQYPRRAGIPAKRPLAPKS